MESFSADFLEFPVLTVKICFWGGFLATDHQF